MHILRCISAGAASHLLIGLHGNPDTDRNKAAVGRADELVALRTELRGKKSPLTIRYYQAKSAKVWG